MAVRSK